MKILNNTIAFLLLTLLTTFSCLAATHSMDAVRTVPIPGDFGRGVAGHSDELYGLGIKLLTCESNACASVSQQCLQGIHLQGVTLTDTWKVAGELKGTQKVTLSSIGVSSPLPAKYNNHGSDDWYTGTGVFLNTTNLDCSGYVHVIAFDSSGNSMLDLAHSPTKVQLLPVVSCSANINDVSFGQLSAGSTVNQMLEITHTGAGKVTIAGKDMQANGILNLGGDPKVTVKTTPDHIDTMTGQWVSGTADSIELSLTASPDAASGKYSSNVTATLTCE